LFLNIWTLTFYCFRLKNAFYLLLGFRVSNHCQAFQSLFWLSKLPSNHSATVTTLLYTFTCGLSDLLLLAVGSLVVFVLREYILKVHILVSSEHKLCQIWNTCIVSCILLLKTYAIPYNFSTTLLLYKLDTLLLKQKNLHVLDISFSAFVLRWRPWYYAPRPNYYYFYNFFSST
jgi:hypothetical protein